MKTIDTLVEDMLAVVDGAGGWDSYISAKFGNQLNETMLQRMDPKPRKEGTLRMSSIGQPCERRLWYQTNTPKEGEPLRPQTKLKFLYGDILEELLLCLAEAAGHRVQGQQDELEIEGIKGHRDAVIDGVTVDVKSASPYSFKKFQEGLNPDGDAFGYLTQLSAYVVAAKDDPIVTEKDMGAFLVIDKTNGGICLDVHKVQGGEPGVVNLFRRRKELVDIDTPPDRGFPYVPEGKSGNLKLGVNCSYCEFKHDCHTGLRTFLSSRGPLYLSRVRREPRMTEIK